MLVLLGEIAHYRNCVRECSSWIFQCLGLSAEYTNMYWFIWQEKENWRVECRYIFVEWFSINNLVILLLRENYECFHVENSKTAVSPQSSKLSFKVIKFAIKWPTESYYHKLLHWIMKACEAMYSQRNPAGKRRDCTCNY